MSSVGLCKLCDGFLETRYRKDGELKRVPTKWNLICDKGYYIKADEDDIKKGVKTIKIEDISYKEIGKSNNSMEIRLERIVDEEAIYQYLIDHSTWSKQTLTIQEMESISKELAEMFALKVFGQDFKVKEGLKVKGTDVRQDVYITSFGIIYYLLETVIIPSSKREMIPREDDLKQTINPRMVSIEAMKDFDSLYFDRLMGNTISLEERKLIIRVCEVIVDLIEGFVSQFIDPFVSVEIVSVVDAVTNEDLQSALDEIHKAVSIIEYAFKVKSGGREQNYSNFCEPIILLLREAGILDNLIETVKKVLLSGKNIKTIFDTNSPEEDFLMRLIDSMIRRPYVKENNLKTQLKNANVNVITEATKNYLARFDILERELDGLVKIDGLRIGKLSYYGITHYTEMYRFVNPRDKDNPDLIFIEYINKFLEIFINNTGKDEALADKRQVFRNLVDHREILIKATDVRDYISNNVHVEYVSIQGIKDIRIVRRSSKVGAEITISFKKPYTDCIENLKWGE